MTIFSLRLLALVSMFCDHVAALFLLGSPLYLPMRMFGRLAFPIFAFLAVEGFRHTANFRRYIARLLFVAAVAQIPYMVCFSDAFRLNVIFQLVAGLLFLWLLEHTLSPMRFLCVVVAIGVLSMASEYGLLAIFLMVAYYSRSKLLSVVFMAFCSFNFLCVGALAYFPLSRYNGQCGHKLSRLVSYGFYPIHLFVLALLYV